MKLKKSQLKVESGQACRRHSHTLQCPQLLQAVRSVPDLQQKAGFTLLSRNSRKLHSRAAQPISDFVAVQPIRSLYTLDSQLPQWTLCSSSQPLPNPSFPYKNKPPSSFSGFAYGFTIAYISQLQSPYSHVNSLC